MSNLVKAYMDDYGKINVVISKHFCEGKTEHVYLIDGVKDVELTIINTKDTGHDVLYEVTYDMELEIGKDYQIMVVNAFRVPLEYRNIVKTKRFNEEFYYPGNDLGCTLGDKVTRFALWAPTASFAKVEIDYLGTVKTVDMRRTENGVYRLTTAPCIIGARYRYVICVNGKWVTCNDPYAKASEPNDGRSVVVDLSKYKTERIHIPEYWRYNQAVIYETSIRDYTEEGTFKAFEKDSDYIADLGVTHVQLMPVYDFGSVDELHPDLYYNWGYDPIQLQCLEGSYSSDVYNPVRGLEDFRDLIYNLHFKGLRVNMDVVFNHVYRLEESVFEHTVPYYFFRYDENYRPTNGSGCGNDFATEMPMARKYIIDTLMYYVDQFDIDGFRFDLMGLMDIETMNEICATLKEAKQDIMLYGEGWNMPTALDESLRAHYGNRKQLPQIAFFNDMFREIIKGDTFDAYRPGYCTGNITMIEQAMEAVKGLMLDTPVQTINYVECHDDMTSFDKLNYCCQSEGKDNIIKRQKLMLGTVILSQGIPFIHSGQEYCRSKQGLRNTYNSGDSINKLNKEDREKYSDVIEYTKQLIEIRKKYKLSKSLEGILEDVSTENMNGILLYKLNHCANENQITIIINPEESGISYHFVGYRKYIFNGEGVVEDKVDIPPLSITILGSNIDD